MFKSGIFKLPPNLKGRKRYLGASSPNLFKYLLVVKRYKPDPKRVEAELKRYKELLREGLFNEMCRVSYSLRFYPKTKKPQQNAMAFLFIKLYFKDGSLLRKLLLLLP